MRAAALLLLVTTLVACGSDPEAERAELRAHGREVFVTYCSLCHGQNADGRGVNADIVRGDPRDFTDPAWRAGATRESVREAIIEGVPDTSMAAWGLLPERDLDGLVEYLLGVSGEGAVPEG